MKCSRHHSFAAWRLHVFHQLLETSHHPYITQRSIVSSAQRGNQASPESENAANDNTKPIPPSQRLPQSPFITYPQTEPKKIRKRRPEKEDLEPLANNPWAVALASPVRLCSLTAARLPRALLGDWGLVRGSDSENIHVLPVGLLKEFKERDSPIQSDQTLETNESTPNEVDTLQESGKNPSRDQQQKHQPVLRMIDRLPLWQKVSPLICSATLKRPAVAKLLPFRWKHPHGPITLREEKLMVWRKDMPEYVHRLIQVDVAKRLERTCLRFPRVEPPNKVWNALEMQDYSDAGLKDALRRLPPVDRAECGAVVLLGSFPGGTILSDAVTLPQSQSTIPIFHMSALLSESDLHKLFEAVPSQFHNAVLLFRPRTPMGIDTMLSLWRLKRFLEDEPRLR